MGNSIVAAPAKNRRQLLARAQPIWATNRVQVSNSATSSIVPSTMRSVMTRRLLLSHRQAMTGLFPVWHGIYEDASSQGEIWIPNPLRIRAAFEINPVAGSFSALGNIIDCYFQGQQTGILYPGAELAADPGQFYLAGASLFAVHYSTSVINPSQASTAVPSAAGTGYTVGDTLTVVGGVFTTAAQFKVATVSSGTVLTVTLLTAGSYTTLPANPASTTGGTGSGCALTVTWAGDYFPTGYNKTATGDYNVGYTTETWKPLVGNDGHTSGAFAFAGIAGVPQTADLAFYLQGDSITAGTGDYWFVSSYTIGSGGTGYAVNDTVTGSGSPGSNNGWNPIWKVTAVSGGVITAATLLNAGSVGQAFTTPGLSWNATTGAAVACAQTATSGSGTGASFNVILAWGDDKHISGYGLNHDVAQTGWSKRACAALGIGFYCAAVGGARANTQDIPSTAGVGVSAFVVANGTAYTVNDVLTVVGGVFATAAQYKVTKILGGGATGPVAPGGLTLQTAGSYSSFPRGVAVSFTGGTGSGVTAYLLPSGIGGGVVKRGAFKYATHMVLALGINDVTQIVASAETYATLQAVYLNISSAAVAQGLTVIPVCLTPNTTSSDNTWSTVVGQTDIAGSNRTNFNAWLRAGQPGLWTPAQVFDPNTVVADAGDAPAYTKWACNGTNFWTVDSTSLAGIHPSPYGHSLISAAFQTFITNNLSL